jgi:hypothetical protein
MGVRKCDDNEEKEVRKGEKREKIKRENEDEYKRYEGKGFRKIKVNIEEINGGEGRINKDLRN